MPNWEYFHKHFIFQKDTSHALSVGFLFQLIHMKKPSKKSLALRKEKLESRLRAYGLDNDIPPINVTNEYNAFVHPQEAAERMLILLAVALSAYNFEEAERIMDWLKKEDLWKSVSDKEKEFFRNPDPGDEEKQNLSWRFEGAFMLAWALGKVSSPAEPGNECNEEQINEFFKHVPTVGTITYEFFSGLKFRAFEDILDENLFYKNATVYFKTILIQDKENTSQVHKKASFQRSLALSWLQNPDEKLHWDAIEAGL